jgi:hypothetical protein
MQSGAVRAGRVGENCHQIRQVVPTDREQALFKTFFIGSAAELAIDQRGRVRVLPRLLKFINDIPLATSLPPGEPRAVLLCRPDPRWML